MLELTEAGVFCLMTERIQQAAKWQAKSEFISIGCLSVRDTSGLAKEGSSLRTKRATFF